MLSHPRYTVPQSQHFLNWQHGYSTVPQPLQLLNNRRDWLVQAGWEQGTACRDDYGVSYVMVQYQMQQQTLQYQVQHQSPVQPDLEHAQRFFLHLHEDVSIVSKTAADLQIKHADQDCDSPDPQ
jgi:hypothetical protein